MEWPCVFTCVSYFDVHNRNVLISYADARSHARTNTVQQMQYNHDKKKTQGHKHLRLRGEIENVSVA